jgi:hypothetical protein
MRKQDTLNPQKYRYVKAFEDLAEDNMRIMTWAQGIKGFKVSERRLIQNYEIDIMNFKVIN